MHVTIRIAQETDLPAIVDIYNQAIALGYATADLTPLSTDSRAAWLAEHTPTTHPVFVAENGGEVLGWCSLSPYRPGRMALRFTAEVSYYVRGDWRGKGIGTQLLGHVIAESPNLGIKTLFAILLDVNIPSVRLLEKFGFEKWGYLPKVADFGGKECGHLYYGLRVKS